MNRSVPAGWRGLLLGGLWLAWPALAGEALPNPNPETAVRSELGRYLVQYASTLEPLGINRIHAWVLKVEDAAGQPMEDAELTISGGMPAHDHGLPTAPKATAYLGDGNYLVEGMKFHMSGAWEVVIVINAAGGKDSVTYRLEL